MRLHADAETQAIDSIAGEETGEVERIPKTGNMLAE
jgi:hypothetical protein